MFFAGRKASPSPWRRLAALVALIASMFVALPAPAATPIRIGTVVWVGYGPFYVADALGLFKKAGLNVEIKMFADPVEIPPAIAGGALQGGMVTYNQVLPQIEKGQMQKVVLPIDYSNGADAIVVAKGIDKIADFKGKKIGLVQLSPSDILLAYAMKKNGLAESDVTLINMAPDAIPPAMAGGQLSVGVTWEPMLSQLLAMKSGKGFKVIYSSKDAPGVITDVLVFDDRFIQSHPKEIETLVRVYLDALAYVKAKPDESAKIIAKVMSITPKEVKEQMPLVRNLQAADIRKAFAKSSEPLSFFGSGPLIGEILKARGEVKVVPAIEDTLEPKFVNAVLGK